jgi:hypothetical protein
MVVIGIVPSMEKRGSVAVAADSGGAAAGGGSMPAGPVRRARRVRAGVGASGRSEGVGSLAWGSVVIGVSSDVRGTSLLRVCVVREAGWHPDPGTSGATMARHRRALPALALVARSVLLYAAAS